MRDFAPERMWEIASLHSSLCATIITQAGCFSNPIFMHFGKNREEIVSPISDTPQWFPRRFFSRQYSRHRPPLEFCHGIPYTYHSYHSRTCSEKSFEYSFPVPSGLSFQFPAAASDSPLHIWIPVFRPYFAIIAVIAQNDTSLQAVFW